MSRSAAYWTSMTSKGCSGALATCQHLPVPWYTNNTGDFFVYLSPKESGSCVSLEEFNEASIRGEFTNLRPRLRVCSSMLNFACEGAGPITKYVGSAFNYNVRFLQHMALISYLMIIFKAVSNIAIDFCEKPLCDDMVCNIDVRYYLVARILCGTIIFALIGFRQSIPFSLSLSGT